MSTLDKQNNIPGLPRPCKDFDTANAHAPEGMS